MADQVDREVIYYVGQRGQVQDMFGDGVRRSGSPRAVAVSAKVDGIDVEILAQLASDPVPIARVVQASVDQDKAGLSIVAPVPEGDFQSVRVVVVGNRFHLSALSSSLSSVAEDAAYRIL